MYIIFPQHPEVPFLSIRAFSQIVDMTVPALRYLCFKGGIRRMLHVRDGSHIYIPVTEIWEYPHTEGGTDKQRIFHYYPEDPNADPLETSWSRQICRRCTYKDEEAPPCNEFNRLYNNVPYPDYTQPASAALNKQQRSGLSFNASQKNPYYAKLVAGVSS